MLLALGLGLTTIVASAQGIRPINTPDDARPIYDEEDRVWDATKRLEHALERSGAIVRDEAVERYLHDIVRRLFPELADIVRVRLIGSAQANAMALAHGTVLFTTELIAMTSSEAELAFVVGHEVAHYKLRHAARKRDRSQSALGAGNLFGIALPILAHVIAASAVAAYSRDMEREADALSLERCNKSGYALNGGVNALRKLEEASKDEKITTANALSSHPQLEERIRSAGEWIRPDEKSALDDQERAHLDKTADLRMRALRSELAANRLASVIRKLDTPDKLSLYPFFARIVLLQAHLRRAADDDGVRANALLSEYLAKEPNDGEALRIGGEMAYKARDVVNAKRWFELALANENDLVRRKSIEEYLKWISEDEKAGSSSR